MPYFDHNATSPLASAAREAWIEAQAQAWQNPGGAYRTGARVRALLDRERERLAAILDANPDRLVFASGATEAANAIFAHLGVRTQGRCLLAATEHSCVRLAAQRSFPARVDWLAHDGDGVVVRAALQERLAAGGVAAVAVMAANNETGVRQPWRDLAADCRAAGVPYVCDAVQWVGKLPAAGLGAADFVFAAAHKFGGPKGAGFLLVPDGEAGRDFASLVGGGQQGGRRAGTEDWPAVAALGAALAQAEANGLPQGEARACWRDDFERALKAALPGTRVVGDGAPRLWNTSMVIPPVGDGARWVLKLDKRGFEVSTAAACSTAQGRSSAVLAALDVPPGEARRALRFSSGWATTEAEWGALLAALRETHAEIAGGVVAGP